MNKKIAIELLESSGNSLYESERKIYPRDVSGRFQSWRKVAVFVLLGIFYGFPWLRWDGRQAVLFDLPARKFYVFGLSFWPQDFVFLALLLIIAALVLFFFTTIAGRLWCGYACPQTVWTEVFLWMEQWTEGDRNRRMKLDKAPWGVNKLLRKGSKHLLWLVFALWTGFTFVGFFTPITELGARAPWQWSGWETFWVLFYALATWGNAGFLREQVCKYMCPYARFQSAMFDRNTLIIAYDPMRGEPRGPRGRVLGSVLQRARGLLDPGMAYDLVFRAAQHPTAADAAVQARGGTAIADSGIKDVAPLPKFELDQLGDCIDCTICVQVCPTGIDIRNGLQYECIACGACIDACDEVMDKVGYPHGLIRYSTQNAIDGKPTRVLRPRVFVYGLLLLTLCAGWAWGVSHRIPLIAEVLRDRNALYRVVGDGRIENSYTLKIINKDAKPQRYRISLQAPGGIVLAGGERTIEAAAEEVLSLPVSLSAPDSLHGKQTVTFKVETLDGQARRSVPSSFFGPL
ncbi:MAG: 4Fe-4S dicluster domain-containing protein [Arenimonas sp.]|jgi:polyferredoxin